MIKISTPVLLGFNRVEPREWGIDGIILELLTEIGSLGRALTIWEDYRYGRKSRHQLGDELSDVFFVLVKLMWDLKIEPSSTLEIIKINTPEEAHFQLMRLATEIAKIKNNTPLPLFTIQKIIEKMIGLVDGLAARYNLPLNQIHEEEMRLATLWQKIFFKTNGKKARFFVFWRKMLWFFIVWRHERAIERM
ncbi:hypothetical protein GYA13_04540 [Candidatus Kuenenbacteria bacterium]|nr:hypothetical protein [Candidatus Kuenenbacteria bacterium]